LCWFFGTVVRFHVLVLLAQGTGADYWFWFVGTGVRHEMRLFGTGARHLVHLVWHRGQIPGAGSLAQGPNP
jgi:hypothetical protein